VRSALIWIAQIRIQRPITVFRIRIWIQSDQWIRIRNQDPDPEGKNDPQKQKKKNKEISCFEVLDVVF
jgi:hypothetical protein